MAAEFQTAETGVAYLCLGGEGALVGTVVEEADDVRVLEFELVHGAGVGLGTGGAIGVLDLEVDE